MSMQQEILKNTLSDMLYHAREKRDFTQSEFAELCALSPRAYEDLELRKSLPSFRTLVNIAIACNLDTNELILRIKESGYQVLDEVNGI